ncbi:MAG: MalY/PatB family protein [Desulfobacterales bacterium]
MPIIDFDTPVDRRGTSSQKWDRYQDRDILPMWVADMDFPSPPAVIDALKARASHPVFGYTAIPTGLPEAVVRHLADYFGWAVEPEWIVWLPGVVTGLNIACRAAGGPGDGVIVMPPVYPPFFSAPGNMERHCVVVPLRHAHDSWTMDLDALEAAATPRTRLVMLCSPHNPVGRVWTRSELETFAEWCRRRDLIVCSDEIHCDLVLDPECRHIPFASLDTDAAQRTITLLAPSKTFNIPGLACSFAVIPSRKLRDRFRKAMAGIVPDVNLMGLEGALAAYRHGGPWLAGLIAYLRGNRDFLVSEMASLPGLTLSPVEATYLAWIDTRGARIDDPWSFFEKAGVGLSDGSTFGGEGFVRLNFGCPRSVLAEAVRRMRGALTNR